MKWLFYNIKLPWPRVDAWLSKPENALLLISALVSLAMALGLILYIVCSLN